MEKMTWHLNDPLGMCHIIQMAMMAFVGQVSTLYALPPSFFCLTATTPSGHHNTHQPLPPHPLALCHLWCWQQHLTTVMRWRWRQADDDDATWQWEWMSTMTINDQGWCKEWDGQQWTTTRTCECSPPPPAPPLIHPYAVLASHSIFSQLHTCFPYVRSSSTSPQPVETETGWDWSFNQQKPTKTTLNQLTSVQSGFSRFFNLWGPVSVPNFDKRPDWTRLPSTIHNSEVSDGVINEWWCCQWVLGAANPRSLVMRRAASFGALQVEEECLRCETFMSMKGPN